MQIGCHRFCIRHGVFYAVLSGTVAASSGSLQTRQTRYHPVWHVPVPRKGRRARAHPSSGTPLAKRVGTCPGRGARVHLRESWIQASQVLSSLEFVASLRPEPVLSASSRRLVCLRSPPRGGSWWRHGCHLAIRRRAV